MSRLVTCISNKQVLIRECKDLQIEEAIATKLHSLVP